MKTELKFEKIKDLVYPNLTVPVYIVTGKSGYVPFIRDRDLPKDLSDVFVKASVGQTTQFIDTAYVHDFEDFMRYSKSDVVKRYRS